MSQRKIVISFKNGYKIDVVMSEQKQGEKSNEQR